MTKTNSNRKKRTKARKRTRAIALTATEPKLRGPRRARTDLTKQFRTSSSAKTLRPTQLYDLMRIWSPWVILLRQQALLARGFFIMMEAQQQFAKVWPLSPYRPAEVGQR
jgi:hypothetical protein